MSFLAPGRSTAATTASNSFSSDCTWRPVTLQGLPDASVSYTISRIPVLKLIFTPLSSRYLTMGSWRYVCGLPSNIRKTEASVRIANNMKIVSMHRAEMWSQSMNPRAYAMGSHMRSMDPREPPNDVNHSVNVISSKSRTCVRNGVAARSSPGMMEVGGLFFYFEAVSRRCVADHVHAAVEVD